MVNGTPNISLKSEIKNAAESPAFRHSPRRRGRANPSRKARKTAERTRAWRQCTYKYSSGTLWAPGALRRMSAAPLKSSASTSSTTTQRPMRQADFSCFTEVFISRVLQGQEGGERHQCETTDG